MCQTTHTCSASAMGDFAKFPPEIMFKILDDILWSTPRLTHRSLCAVANLTKASRTLDQFIRCGWMGTKASTYLSDSVNGVEWYVDSDHAWEVLHSRGATAQTTMPIGGHPELGPDLITGIILDDCTHCFKWFSEILPPAHMSCCNEGGWSFLALALHGKSENIIDDLFAAGYPYEPSDFIAGGANAIMRSPSNIGIAASSKNHQTFARFLRMLKDLLTKRGFSRALKYRLTKREVAAIRSVAPPYLQKMLADAGLMTLRPTFRYSPYNTSRRVRMF